MDRLSVWLAISSAWEHNERMFTKPRSSGSSADALLAEASLRRHVVQHDWQEDPRVEVLERTLFDKVCMVAQESA